jgi:hypothetical protein
MPKRCLYYAGIAACLLSASQTARAQATSTEAQAFVTDSSARFVFPLDRRTLYSWDLPLKGAQSGMPEFSWMVTWYRVLVPGKDPMGLWLMTRWKVGGPRSGTLADLIRGYTLDPMIECLTCDGAVFRDPKRDTTTVFATIEGGRLVFNVRGREAIHRIFPVLSQTVTFSRSIRQTPHSYYGPGEITETQVVIVNCSSGGDRRRRRSCVVPPVVSKPPPDADSAAAENAPRQVYVPVIRFADAALLKHVNVRIKRTDGTIWRVISSGSLGAIRLSQPPIGPLLLQALCPPRGSKPRTISGSVFVQITPRTDTSVHLMADPTICPR